jgi:hypothetical protein
MTEHLPRFDNTSPTKDVQSRRIIIPYELMLLFHLPLFNTLSHCISERIAKIEVKKDYFMPELVDIRGLYILVALSGNYVLNNFTCLTPHTAATATDLMRRGSWDYFFSIWLKHGRHPHVPEFPTGKNPKPEVQKYPEPVKGYVLKTELEQLKQAFEKDLHENYVFQLSLPESEFYKQEGQHAFKASVFKRYKTIKKDIRAAGRCYATASDNDYTACVFHLMRAAEIVLQDLAFRFNISPDWPDKQQPNHKPGKKTWGDFIGSIEFLIGSTIATTLIADVEVRTELSHAMVASRKLKKLRNNTDHIYLLLSEFYDRDEAFLIWKQTKAFIEHSAQTF